DRARALDATTEPACRRAEPGDVRARELVSARIAEGGQLVEPVLREGRARIALEDGPFRIPFDFLVEPEREFCLHKTQRNDWRHRPGEREVHLKMSVERARRWHERRVSPIQ